MDAIITGHSTVMTWADLREYAQFNKDFAPTFEAGIRAGKSVDDIAAGWKINDKYKGYNDRGCAREDQRAGHRERAEEIVGRDVGGAFHGSSGQGCFGYRPRNSFLTSGYVRSQKLRRSRVT